MHIWSNHTLRIILALHHCSLQTILKIANLLLGKVSSLLVGDLTLVGTLFNLFLPSVFTRSNFILIQTFSK